MLINEVTNTNKFRVSSQSNFARGFTVELFVGNAKVGAYKYSVDEEGDAFHDVSISPEFQRKGYGTMLVLKAIQTAHDNELGYGYDSLGQTKDFDALQQSLAANGLVHNSALTDKGEDALFDFTNG
jgi:GNAT superfamily N-acetyltransferase